ncbi:MAG: thiamine phosphate synthase [Chloroflexi bacterium]|nr:thiamine phosphate synthase [Chloroflexota bacterium]
MLRLIDANLNRAREGTRVLEDVARFLLNDRTLTERLRVLRHALGDMVRPLTLPLVAARRAAEDVGGPSAIRAVIPRTGLDSLVAANARRVAESLRVLEECAKLPDAPAALAAATLERARFEIYELERLLLGGITRRTKREMVRGLYVIIDPAMTAGRDPVAIAQDAIAGGARVIQWRDKERPKGVQLTPARRIRELCQREGALFFINDHPDLAVAVDADGVHVGQKDLPLPVVRRMLRLDQLVGVSTATGEEARLAVAEDADYLAVGAIFPTQSKSDTRPAGLETLRAVRAEIDRPLVAIGGITPENVGHVVAAGADAVAVISAVTLAPDVRAAARKLVEEIAGARGHD